VTRSNSPRRNQEHVCPPDLTHRQLSAGRQQLVTLVHGIHFGRIERLTVRAAEPIFEPPPRVIRTIKVGGSNQPRSMNGPSNFALRQEWVEFFDHLDVLQCGVVLVIEIMHGLPTLFEVEGT
jgi:hypothetical protein